MKCHTKYKKNNDFVCDSGAEKAPVRKRSGSSFDDGVDPETYPSPPRNHGNVYFPNHESRPISLCEQFEEELYKGQNEKVINNLFTQPM